MRKRRRKGTRLGLELHKHLEKKNSINHIGGPSEFRLVVTAAVAVGGARCFFPKREPAASPS